LMVHARAVCRVCDHSLKSRTLIPQFPNKHIFCAAL
jgi:hypothetical protein